MDPPRNFVVAVGGGHHWRGLFDTWLRLSDPLDRIARGEGAAEDRLRSWVLTLVQAKIRKVTADPEYFATYQAIARGSTLLVARHLATLVDQVEWIIAAGVARGEFRVTAPRRAAEACLNATTRFHHPAILVLDNSSANQGALDDVLALLIAGLQAGVL